MSDEFSPRQQTLIDGAKQSLAYDTSTYYSDGLRNARFRKGAFAFWSPTCKGPGLWPLAKFGDSPTAQAKAITQIIGFSLPAANGIVAQCKGSQLTVLDDGGTPFARIDSMGTVRVVSAS